MKYALFGAGINGKNALGFLGKDNVACFLDNDLQKNGVMVDGVVVRYYPCAIDDIRNKEYRVLICVSSKWVSEIKEQLKKDGLTGVCFDEERISITKKKISSRPDYIEIYNKAIKWVYTYTVENKGIVVTSILDKPYPEVTGYFIPTLLRWGHRELAIKYARWLCGIQKENGSWYDPDDKDPFVFDTGQILKGLIAIRDILPNVDKNIMRGCEWLYLNIQPDGRLPSPRTGEFGDGKTIHEIIHLYCLSPLVEASKIFDIPKYKEAAYRSLEYYKKNYSSKILNFNLLSHFYGYVMEALYDLGENDLVADAMSRVSDILQDRGFVPGYFDADWVCSTGLFQLALVWYKLKDIKNGNKAFFYACKLQNHSGGWYGGYPSGDGENDKPAYFPDAEISWANKYFLDALFYKSIAEFESQASNFKNNISMKDGRYSFVETVVRKKGISSESKVNVLDVGCGKGAYLKNLRQSCPEVSLFGVDISDGVMEYIDDGNIEKKQGSITNIPFDDCFFDVTYTCEALEHAIDIRSAVREMARVTSSGGFIVIIDKNKDRLGEMEIEEWEQWFDESELRGIMLDYCDEVDVDKEISYEIEDLGLFYAWLGRVK